MLRRRHHGAHPGETSDKSVALTRGAGKGKTEGVGREGAKRAGAKEPEPRISYGMTTVYEPKGGTERGDDGGIA
jgi:hypothetical protein